MIVVGGTDGFDHPIDDLWVYHFADDEWFQETPANSPGPRTGHQLCLSSTSLKLYLQGGSFDDNSVWILDLDIRPVAFGPKLNDLKAKEDEWVNLAFFNLGEPITEWRFEISEDWLKWNGATLNLSGTPRNGDVGITNITVNVTNGKGDYDHHSFDITVSNTLPTILGEDVLEAVEDIEYLNDYDCTDDGSGIITWTLTSAAETWLSIDSDTAVLKGTPDNSAIGVFKVKVSVNDGHGVWVRRNFELNVTNVNDPPEITIGDRPTVYEDEHYISNYTAFDPDPTEDTLIWMLKSDAGFLKIDQLTGVLSGTPDNGDVGSYWVNVSVADGNGGRDFTNFSLTVENVNDPPIVEWVGSHPAGVPVLIEINEGDELWFEIVAEDIDGDDITYGFSSPVDWAEVHTNGTLQVAPPVGTWGTYWGNLTAEDGNEGTDVVEVKIVVFDVNFPPVIIDPPAGVVEALEDVPFSLTMVAQDVDDDPIRWLDDSSLLDIGQDNGTIAFTPSQEDVGTYNIEIKAADGNGGIATFVLVLEVINVNDPPVLLRLEPENGSRYKKGKEVPLRAQATDEDGDVLIYTWKLGEEILGTGNEFPYKGLGKGTHVITLEVSDGTDTITSDLEVVVKATKKDTPGINGLLATIALLVTHTVVRVKRRPR
jgi:hypothetical protein